MVYNFRRMDGITQAEFYNLIKETLNRAHKAGWTVAQIEDDANEALAEWLESRQSDVVNK